MSWKDKLLPSERALVEDILSQIPEAMNARASFEGCLNKIASGDETGEPRKYRYALVMAIDGDVYGTNDEQAARDHAENDEDFVIDMTTGKVLVVGGMDDDMVALS